MPDKYRQSDEPRSIDLSGGNSIVPQLYDGIPKSFCVRNALEALSLEASGKKPEEYYDPRIIRDFNPNNIRTNK